MSTRLEFDLSNEDMKRLFYLKRKSKFKNATGNEYAKSILVRELRKSCVIVPEYDETGM